MGIDEDTGLGLGDVNELAAAAGSGVSGEKASEGEARPVEPAVTAVPETKKPKLPKSATPGGGAGAAAPASSAPTTDPKEIRIGQIKCRLAEIGDPFALRQKLADDRAAILAERQQKDDDLRKRLAEAETALSQEQDKAQWVAQEKHDLERELAKLEK